jgi:hypothetical protein
MTRPYIVHDGQHSRHCAECETARATWTRGYCQCEIPIVEHLALWNTDQCGRCGRELQP